MHSNSSIVILQSHNIVSRAHSPNTQIARKQKNTGSVVVEVTYTSNNKLFICLEFDQNFR